MERISHGSLGVLETTLVEVGRGKRVILSSIVFSNSTEGAVNFHCYVSMDPSNFHICPRGMVIGPGDTVVLEFPVALESKDKLVGFCSLPGAVQYYATGTVQNVVPQPS